MDTDTVTTQTQTRLDTLKQLAALLFERLPSAESANLMERIQTVSEATEYRPASLERLLESILKDYGIVV